MDGFRTIYVSRTETSRSDMIGIACLAFIGALSILNIVAHSAYRLGRYHGERTGRIKYRRYSRKD